MTLRKDLKPGDLFRYKYGNLLFWVPVDNLDRPRLAETSIPGPLDLEREVVVESNMSMVPEPRRANDSANPKAAFGDKKVPLHLVPPALDIAAAKGLKEGGKKYGPYNWRESKVELMTYIAAMKRHLFALQDGEDIDPDSAEGKLHIDGLAANCAILADAYYGGFLIDNRPPPGPAPRLILPPKDQK